MQIKTLNKSVYLYAAAIGLLLVVGFVLRIIYLEQYPRAVNQDELSNIYDGYSILLTGADRWGQRFPLILRGFGNSDYRPPLYAWLSVVPIKLLGYSIFSGRLVSAVLGWISLIPLYLVARRLGGRRLAFFALLLATFSPWHLLFSRIASEGTMLPPFFVIWACYFWQRARDRAYSLPSLALLGLCIGLGTNTYQASKLVFFFFTLLVVFDLWRNLGLAAGRFWSKAVFFGVSCLVGAAPQIAAAITMPKQFFARANGSMMPFSFSFQYLNDFLKHLLINISPDFLFFSFGSYNNLSSGRLLMVEFLVFYVGLVVLSRVFARDQVIKPAYFYALLLFCVFPSALTTDNPHALRASGLAVLLPLVSAAGIMFIYQRLSRELYRRLFLVGSAALIVVNGVFFIVSYTRSEELRNQGMHALLAESSQKLNHYKNDYDKIFIEDTGGQNYLYTVSYCDMKPAEFQRAVKKYNTDVWDEFKQVNQYYFLNQGEINDKLKQEPPTSKVLLLLHSHNANFNIIDSTTVNREQVFFYQNQPAKTWE